MSRAKATTKLAVPEIQQARTTDQTRSRHDFESAAVQVKSPSRRSAPTIRVAGGSSYLDEAPLPPANPRPPQRSLSQPSPLLRAPQQSGRPSWVTEAQAPFQVVHPSSQHPTSQTSTSRHPVQPPAFPPQASSKRDFSRFAYSGPSDPSQAPVGRRLTLPPAVSRSSSARPFTAQGAEYRTGTAYASIQSHVPEKLDDELRQMIDKAKATSAVDTAAEDSKPKRKRKKKDEGPKKVDLSVPEEGSWIRGEWVPDDTGCPERPATNAVSQDHATHDKGKTSSTSYGQSSQHLPVHPEPVGDSCFLSNSSLPVIGRPESQLPPGRQPQRDVSSSVSNRRYPSSQRVPTHTSPVTRQSAVNDTQEPLFLPHDSDDEPSSDRRHYRGQARFEEERQYPSGQTVYGPSQRAATTRDDGISYEADRHNPPSPRPLQRTSRSSRSEKTYSTRLPMAYTHRHCAGEQDPAADELDDGVSYNKDLIRSKRRRTTHEPSEAPRREPLREIPYDLLDDARSPLPGSLARDERRDANPPRQERLQHEHDQYGQEEGEVELEDTSDQHIGDGVDTFPPFDDYQANTPSPPPSQRQKILPGHQQAVDELFETPTRHPSSYDPTTMRPLTERFVLIPGQQYPPVPTQSPGVQGRQGNRKRSKSSRKHRHTEKCSPRRHPKDYHDRDYPSERRHKHHHCSRSRSSHRHHHHSGYSEDYDETPRGRLRMSRHESVGPRIDKYVENSRRQLPDATQRPRPPHTLRPHQSAPRRKPDPKIRAAQRAFDLSPIKSVFGEEKRQVMLERTQLQSHPVDKHLIGAASKDRRRERLEQLTGLGRPRQRRKEKENTAPRSAPATFTFQRPSDVAGDEEMVRATQSTIGQFPTQGSVSEVRHNRVEPWTRRKKVPQLRFTRRVSPDTSLRAPAHTSGHQHAGPSHNAADDQAGVSHPAPSQHTPTPLRPATPLNDIIPPLARVPIGVGVPIIPQTPQRSMDPPKTPTSVMSTRDRARAQRDAADQALVDAMLTPADAEKLARELAKESGQAETGGEVVEVQESIGDFDMGPEPGENSAIRSTSTHEAPPPPMSRPAGPDPTQNTPSKAPDTANAITGPSRSVGKTMTREAISDTGQEMRELLKKLKSSASPSKQSSGKSGLSTAKGNKHDRARRRKHPTATPQSDPRQATLPGFMQKILPDGPPIPTQAEIRPTQVTRKTPEDDFEVKLKEPRQLLISDLAPSSSRKRLGKHLFEDLPGSGKDQAVQGSGPTGGKNTVQKSKTAPNRLGLGLPARQPTQSQLKSHGTQFSQAVIRPYKDPTTADTPRMVQEDRERAFLTPTQRSLGPSQKVDDEFEEFDHEDELIDDDETPAAPFVHPLHKTITPMLQRSLAEAPLKGNRPGTTSSKGTTPGFVPPKPIDRTTTSAINRTKTGNIGTNKNTSLGLTQARDILAEDSHDMIEDNGEEEDYFGEFDSTEDFKGLDHALGLTGLSFSSGPTDQQGHMQGGTWWR